MRSTITFIGNKGGYTSHTVDLGVQWDFHRNCDISFRRELVRTLHPPVTPWPDPPKVSVYTPQYLASVGCQHQWLNGEYLHVCAHCRAEIPVGGDLPEQGVSDQMKAAHDQLITETNYIADNWHEWDDVGNTQAIEHNGQARTIREWERHYHLRRRAILNRLHGRSFELALKLAEKAEVHHYNHQSSKCHWIDSSEYWTEACFEFRYAGWLKEDQTHTHIRFNPSLYKPKTMVTHQQPDGRFLMKAAP